MSQSDDASTTTEAQTPPPRETSYPIVPLVVLAVVLLVTFAARWRLLDLPLERDEGEFAYMGQWILQGVPPYKEATNMKWPGTYAAYAVGMAAFGETTRGVHLTLLALNLFSIVMVYPIASRMGGALAAAFAPAAFALLTFSPFMSGFATHASQFVVAAMLVALWTLLPAMQSARMAPWRLLLSGFWFGVAALMKQPGLAYSGIAILLILEWHVRRRPFQPIPLLRDWTLSAIGILFPLLATAAYIYAASDFDRFWFWTVDYARNYGQPFTFPDSAVLMGNNFKQHMLKDNETLIAMACLGLLAPWWTPSLRSQRLFCIALAVTGVLALCPGAVFRNHYYVFLTPAVALLTGIGLASLGERMPFVTSKKTREDLVLVVGAVVLLWPVYRHSRWILDISPEQLTIFAYRQNPFNEAPEIAAYLKRHTNPDDRIAILGSEPEILFHAKRRSATEFLYTYPLMEMQPFAKQMQQQMIDGIKRSKPKFMVWVNVPFSWLQREDSETIILQWAAQYLRDHYDLVAYMPLDKNERANLIEGDQARNLPWQDGLSEGIFLFRRRDTQP